MHGITQGHSWPPLVCEHLPEEADSAVSGSIAPTILCMGAQVCHINAAALPACKQLIDLRRTEQSQPGCGDGLAPQD